MVYADDIDANANATAEKKSSNPRVFTRAMKDGCWLQVSVSAFLPLILSYLAT